MDEMETYEIAALMKYSYFAIKDNWEQARLIAYMVAQVNSKHRLKIEDILPFSWEKEEEEEEDTAITKKEIESLKAQAQQYINSKNKTNG